jgi:hypothetical protein
MSFGTDGYGEYGEDNTYKSHFELLAKYCLLSGPSGTSCGGTEFTEAIPEQAHEDLVALSRIIDKSTPARYILWNWDPTGWTSRNSSAPGDVEVPVPNQSNHPSNHSWFVLVGHP